MRRAIVITVIAAVFITASVGAATSLGIGAGNLAAGSGTVGRCHTTAAPTFDKTADGGKVTHIIVIGLDQSCTGGRLTLTLLDGAGAVTGSGTLAPIPSARPFSVPVSAPPDEDDVVSVAIAIVGPQP